MKPRLCKQCGKPITYKPYDTAQTYKEKSYCSKRCVWDMKAEKAWNRKTPKKQEPKQLTHYMNTNCWDNSGLVLFNE